MNLTLQVLHIRQAKSVRGKEEEDEDDEGFYNRKKR